jgi:hypothetical protein
MKAHILFDDNGHIGAMSHAKKSASGKPGGFRPGPGQHTAFLEIPAEFANLNPRELHEQVRVERGTGTVRLVAKGK